MVPSALRLPRRVVPLPRLALGHRALAVLALIGANMLWGGSPAATRGAMGEIGPLTVGAGRVGIAALVFWLLLAPRGERFATGRVPALLGLTGMALFVVTQNVGLRYADATTSAMIGGAQPVVIAALAVPLLGERLHPRQLAGLGLSLAGVALLVLAGSGRTPEAALGNLLPLASAVAFSLYAVLSRRAFGALAALPVIAGATRYAVLMLLPLVIGELALTGMPAVSAEGGLLLIYLGVGCSALAFVLCGFGYSRLAASRAAPYSNLKLLAGVALSVSLLGEPLTAARIAGGVVILAGVALASVAPVQTRMRPTPEAGSTSRSASPS